MIKPRKENKVKPTESGIHAGIYVCHKCGGRNLEVKAWVDPNTLKYIDSCEFGSDDRWCRDCEDHTDQIDKNEFNLKKS